MKPAQIRMQDIARRAGVHSSTVSRALRNDPRITPSVREAIQRIARSMRYRPNPLVSALISTRRLPQDAGYRATLGYLSKFPADRATELRKDYEPMLAGAMEAAARHGFSLEEFKLDDPALSPERLRGILHARNIPGLMLAPLYTVNDSVGIDWSAFSVVAVGLSQVEAAFTRVSHDHFADAQLALRHCREYGYRRIGFTVPRRVNEKVENRWLAAYLLDQAACPPKDRIPPLLLDADHPAEFRAWYGRHRPQAVVCTNIPAIAQLVEAAGGSVPRDTGLVSLGFSVKSRQLAGVHHDLGRLGAVTIDLLVGMLYRNERGVPEEPQTIQLAGRWADGRSLPAGRAVQ